MKAIDFTKKWESFSTKFCLDNPNWADAYRCRSAGLWTDLFLGGKRSSQSNSPIGEEFKKVGLLYRSEDGLYDLSLYSSDIYKNIGYLERNELKEWDLPDLYPVNYRIIIEIENNSNSSWREMVKLTWVKCPLKVLVTYKMTYNDDEKTFDMLCDNFSTIIKQSNETFRENEATEYLLVFGEDNKPEKTIPKLSWKYIKFDCHGNPKRIEPEHA